MIELRHRQIAHIAGPRSLSTGLMRQDAFLAALRACRIVPERDLLASSRAFNEDEGPYCCRSLLDLCAAAGVRRFTAIVCANDRLAIGAIRTLRDDGHACPHDVSVSGYNDMDFVDRIDPPLTTVRSRNARRAPGRRRSCWIG